MALTVTIDRTSLSLSPLVMSGTDDSNDLGVVNYTPPAKQQRLGQMPDSDSVHGTEYTSMAYQQARMNFDIVTDKATDEAGVQTYQREVEAALGQFEFTVTTQVGNADAEVWSANAGDLIPPARTYVDLVNHNPVYGVSIPVFPVPS